MASITITISDLPHANVCVATDADQPAIGRPLTPAQGLAMELLGTAFKRGATVVYDPEQVPTVALALDLLHVEGLAHAVTFEIRNRARVALGRDRIDRAPAGGVDIDRVHRARLGTQPIEPAA